MNRLKIISIIFLLSTFLFSFINSCDSTNPKPTEKPPGYQEDIPWPSLGNSPNPIVHGNPQFTSRYSFPGPQFGQLVWKYSFETNQPSNDSFSSPIIKDSLVIFVSYGHTGDTSSYLIALNNVSGALVWKFPLSGIKNTAPPIAVKTGTIYTADWAGKLYAVNMLGQLIWQKNLPSPITNVMNIDTYGNLYAFCQNGIVYSFDQIGSQRWTKDLMEDFGSSSSAIVFSPKGDKMFITGKKLTALSVDGEILWSLFDEDLNSILPSNIKSNTWWGHPVVDNDENIYLFGGFVKISGDGTQVTNLTTDPVSNIDPTIDKSGNVYVGLDSGEILSISHDGNTNWRINFNIQDATSIICDNNSNIYFVSKDGYVNSIDNDGNILWRYYLEGRSYYSPALSNGFMFLSSVGENGKLFLCIK